VIEMLMNAAMEIERAKAIGAKPYERSQRRKAHANGFKKRKFLSRMGELDLKIPQVRGLAFYSGWLAHYSSKFMRNGSLAQDTLITNQ
jgi:transposase-like protein